MRLPSSPHPAQQLVDDINCVASFLAADDFQNRQPDKAAIQRVLGAPAADVLVLLGNSVLHTAEHAFAAMRANLARHLLICGGRGHSTDLLRENLRRDLHYQTIASGRTSEAELLAEVATRFHHIDRKQITLETESANCGENAQFALRTLQQAGIACHSILLVQDPTMQRRSAASFAKAWQDDGRALKLANFPTFIPAVQVENESLAFVHPEVRGLWPMERFVSLLLGEIPRLHDDAKGYGPRGRGFIPHVDIPRSILAAHERIASHFPHLLR